jgi:anti-sigma factor ChrR (cupin superfamily)
VYGFAVGALSAMEAAQLAEHLAECEHCRATLDTLRPIVAAFVHWPSDVLRPSLSLWTRLAERLEGTTDTDDAQPLRGWQRPEWKEVAPGISVKLLATDLASDRVSMLVRLAPGVSYPPHSHAGVEELHLQHGELYINERKLYPGEYSRAEPGTSDYRVYSETGCTCVLITSPSDVLR